MALELAHRLSAMQQTLACKVPKGLRDKGKQQQLTCSWDFALMVSGSKSSSADCIISAGPPAEGVTGSSVSSSPAAAPSLDPLALLLIAVDLWCGAGWACFRGAARASKLTLRLEPNPPALQQLSNVVDS